MNDIARALPWGIAMIALAIGRNYGFVDANATDTLFIILPILAMLAVTGRSSRAKLGDCETEAGR